MRERKEILSMAATEKNGTHVRLKSTRLSLKGAKQLSDISPAPVPRSSHRIRTGSSDSEEKPKNNAYKRSQSSNRSSTNSLNSYDGNKSNHSDPKETNSNGYLFNGFSLSGRAHGICPLANLGNTCFLNSVLYALRFLPGFAHDLHHLHTYLDVKSNQEFSFPLSQRLKCLSELHSIFNFVWTEEHSNVDGKRIPAFQPLKFLESVRIINPQFEGNRQQDAHELLHWMLDQFDNLPQDVHEDDQSDIAQPRAKRRKKNRLHQQEIDYSKSFDVVGSKFVGKMSLETRCSECEQTNRREERFLELCVPVKTKAEFDDDEEITDTEVLMTALCTEDSLVGNNKYFCEFCTHHNEAQRFVHFISLPHNLVIHVKRFSSYTNRTFATKCCDVMPAPFELPCFCYSCRQRNSLVVGNGRYNDVISHSGERVNKNKRAQVSESEYDTHLPYYLRAFVCHLGATISSGHYISFVHVSTTSPHSCDGKLKKKQSNSSDLPNSLTDCSFLRCCSSLLEKVSPKNVSNGKDVGLKCPSSAEDGFWLECDDEKIKVASFSDVSSAMNSNIVTPYLLFYSR